MTQSITDHESNGPSLICNVHPWYLRAYNGLAEYTCEVLQGDGVGYRGAASPPFRKVASLPMCSQFVALPRSCRTESETSDSRERSHVATWKDWNLCSFESNYEGRVRFGEVCMHRLVELVRPPKPLIHFQTSKHLSKVNVPDGD